MPKWHESDCDFIGPIEHIYGKKSSAYQNSRLTPLASRLCAFPLTLFQIIYFADDKLSVGLITRQKLVKLHDDGDIGDQEIRNFYKAVREFYSTASSYALKNLPISGEVLQNAQFAHFNNRLNSNFTQVLYFVSRYVTTAKYLNPY